MRATFCFNCTKPGRQRAEAARIRRERTMTIVSRRSLLAGSAAILATPHIARAQAGKPKVTVISQWSAGSDGLAITTLGKRFEAEGGIWDLFLVHAVTTEM